MTFCDSFKNNCLQSLSNWFEQIKRDRFSVIIKSSLVLVLVAVIYFIPKAFFLRLIPKCLFNIAFNIECFGCGTSRSVWHLLRFELSEAFLYNKVIVITFPLLVFCVIKWIFDKNEIDEKIETISIQLFERIRGKFIK